MKRLDKFLLIYYDRDGAELPTMITSNFFVVKENQSESPSLETRKKHGARTSGTKSHIGERDPGGAVQRGADSRAFEIHMEEKPLY
jgi:hypothetical protein